MVLEDPLTAFGVAAFVFFMLLGILYLWDPDIEARVWVGIQFVLVGVTILLLLINQPGVAGVVVGAIGGFVAKRILKYGGVGE